MSIRHCLLLWLPDGDTDSDAHWANWLQKYHSSRLWLAMRRELSHNEAAFNHYCRQLVQQYQLKAVACGAVLMHIPERLALQHCITAIKAGKPIAELGRQLLSNAERALRPLAKLEKLFSTELLQQSGVIAARCTFSLQELKYQYPSELVPAGETAAGYLAYLVVQGSKRVVIDSLGAFSRLAIDPTRLNAFFRALAGELRARDVSVMLTWEMRDIFGAEISAPAPDLSSIVDNLILMRFFENHAELRRTLSILKIRDSSYDPSRFVVVIRNQDVFLEKASRREPSVPAESSPGSIS